MKATTFLLSAAILTAAGCGAPVAAPSATSPIAVSEDQHAFVKKALKDAGIEGEVVSVDLFKGNYETMVQAPAAAAAGGAAGDANASGAGDSFVPPRSYTITTDGKVKKGL
ncbi:MAG TPA: hypothetical protein VNC50_21295 [Planctomycetia bacterium]|nr:hypothetical protein [Planctomycetia bacterium]